MPQLCKARRPLGELDFADQPRLHELGLARDVRASERADGPCQRFEEPGNLDQHPVREVGYGPKATQPE
jgi:hypothetical protein